MSDFKARFDLTGKTAIITGAAGGIGAECALAIADAGASVVLTDLQVAECEAVAKQIKDNGGKAIVMEQDVTSEERWKEVIADTIKEFGSLDILINNAGIEIFEPMLETTLENWKTLHAVNCEGVFLGTKYCVKEMMPGGKVGNGGSIVNISSIAGFRGMPGLTNYCSSKGAVRLFTKAAAVECASMGSGVRVNSIHPGVIETPMVTRGLPPWADVLTGGDVEACREALEGKHALGRFGEPIEIATAVLFLASDASSFMTGTEIVIDGGWTAA